MSDFGFTQRIIGQEERPQMRPAQKTPLTVRVQRLVQRGWLTVRGRWKKPKDKKEWKMLIVKIVGGLFGLGVVTVAILWFTLPNIDDPATMFPSQSTVILDRNGVELYRLYSEQDRTYIHGDQISPFVKQATIAIEDERFFNRSACFDVIGYMRAVMSQIAPSFFVRSGGSTLTQQFAGNALVGRRRSLIRKAQELLLACQLETKYNKEELLELYLNWIPYGQNAYGIEQASKNYFGKSAKDLTLAESAVLASLPQRPSYFNPYGSHVHTTVSDQTKEAIISGTITTANQIPDNAVRIGLIGQRVGSGSTTVYIGGRTDQVLKNMFDQKHITQEQYNQALDELAKLKFAPERQNIRAAHFVLSIQDQVEELLGIDESFLQQGGLKITTTLDWELQQAAEKVVADHKDDIRKRFGAYNMALVSVAPETREILAYVGNADFSDDEHEGKIDMAVSPRQPGSSFKAFTYLAAFEAGYGPGTVIYDVATKFGGDEPQNFDGSFWGLMSMRTALGASRNIPAIKAFFLGGGEESLLSLAARLGVTAPRDAKAKIKESQPEYDYGWPLSIGAAEVPLVQMVQGYATIADGGVLRPMKSIVKITDKDGNLRYAPKEDIPSQVVDERIAAQVTSVLSDLSARPNEFWKTILSVPGYQAAAKTGTSNKCLERDGKGGCTLRRPESTWTMGYTPNLITGVWVGNATSQSLFEKADGLTTAAPVWHDYMAAAHRKMKNAKAAFTEPSGLSHPLISKLSGKLASACTPVNLQTTDVFLDERVPTEEDPACAKLKVDKVTMLLSSPECPAEAAFEESFFIPKSELPDRWPLWETAVTEWSAEQMKRWNANETHSGSQLPLPIAPTKVCDPSLTPGRFTKPTISISFPLSGESVAYPAFVPAFTVKSEAKIREVKIEIDDKPIRSFTESPFEGSVRVPRTVEQAGSHTLSITVIDEYFNSANDTAQFRFE
jgi:membrane peptidoglycan carboxypeptidase